MSSVTGIAPAGVQVSAAVYNITATEKAPPERRDDYVASVETTNTQAAKADISLLKMSDSSVGQQLDIQV